MGIFGKPESKAPETPPHRVVAVPASPVPVPPTASSRAPLCVIGPKTTIKGEITGDEA